MAVSIAQKKTEIAKAFAPAIREALARRDTDHVAFSGCIDWHSAVHGTWALTAYTRMTGDQQHAPFIAAILTPEKIEAERTFVASQPNFEMPYGRAWFLRLAMEHRLAFGGDALKPMAEDILQSLLGHYASHEPDPRRGSYESDSWTLINMYDYAVSSQNASALARVRGWVEQRFIAYEGEWDYGLETGHFMAIPTNWAWLVSRIMDPAAFEHWARAFFARSGLPSPVTQPVNWHHHGLNFSRAWGLLGLRAATASVATKEAYLEAYLAHFRTAYDNPDLWRGSYQGVGHWVPQFGMFALQPLFADDTAPTA